jgi:hypothetical protein
MNTISESSVKTSTALAILAGCLMLLAQTASSGTFLSFGGTRAVPFDEGDYEDLPAVTARICNLAATNLPGGCIFAFSIEVSEDCWKPIYSISMKEISGAIVEPISCPVGWTAQTGPSGIGLSGSMVFTTRDDPILPGSVLGSFSLASYSGSATLRWFPADVEGILVGRVSKLNLACPTATEDRTWGSIKALFR